jgi:hypothetical protein
MTSDDEFVDVYFDSVAVTLVESLTLGPAERVLVVRNRAAFESRYGQGLRIAGEYGSSKLDNIGEQIRVREPQGGIVHEFTYSDDADWLRDADGRGKSLELIDVFGNYNDPRNWRPSREIGGNPGVAGYIAGDVTGDGVFDGSDLVVVAQAAEYEDIIPGNSSFTEGDFNGDGEFTTADLVLAFQSGVFRETDRR